MIKPTDREDLEQWLKHCHSRKDKLGVAGMLLLFEPGADALPEDSEKRAVSIYSRIKGNDKMGKGIPDQERD